MTYIFLDTNIFLHFKWYEEIPWNTVIGKGTYTPVIPPIVIYELDNHKNHSSKRINQRARSIIARLEVMVESKAQTPIFLHSMPTEEGFQKYNLDKNKADDCLLVSLLEFSVSANTDPILITNDLGMKMKALGLNVKCVRLDNEHRIPEELDETEKQLDQLRKELADLKHRQPKVTLQFENSGNQLYLSPSEFNLGGNEWDFVKRYSEQNKLEFEHLKMPSKEELQNTDEKNTFKILSTAMFPSLSQDQIDSYNKGLDEYFISYQNYLHKEYQYQLQQSNTFAVNIELRNDGTLPAEDIDVFLHFPDGFEVLEEIEDAPSKPLPPYKPKSRFDFNFGSSMPILPDIFLPNYDNHVSQNSGPSLTRLEKTNSYEVEFTLQTLKHNQSQLLPILFIRYENLFEMKNFTIDYSLFISNVSKKIEGKLHVIFKTK
jgi:rRNA-processing protein FCF1